MFTALLISGLLFVYHQEFTPKCGRPAKIECRQPLKGQMKSCKQIRSPKK